MPGADHGDQKGAQRRANKCTKHRDQTGNTDEHADDETIGHFQHRHAGKTQHPNDKCLDHLTGNIFAKGPVGNAEHFHNFDTGPFGQICLHHGGQHPAHSFFAGQHINGHNDGQNHGGDAGGQARGKGDNLGHPIPQIVSKGIQNLFPIGLNGLNHLVRDFHILHQLEEIASRCIHIILNHHTKGANAGHNLGHNEQNQSRHCQSCQSKHRQNGQAAHQRFFVAHVELFQPGVYHLAFNMSHGDIEHIGDGKAQQYREAHIHHIIHHAAEAA